MDTSAELLLERVRSATEDEYTVEGELGRGGMAAVYLARDIALERRVAIKVMLPDLVDMAGIQDRFVIEARTAAHLDHPGIVTIYSVKQRAGLLFIVMKYIEGRTLDAVLKGDRRLEPAVVTTIVSQVAEALHFAHGEGIIHRDVKPSNIIIDTRGRPVVTDFGIAKITSGRSITVTGSMIGTPAYMSPEQCRGLPATAASDQYSLGVMLYEMLGGALPFQGTIFELIHAHCDEPPPPLRDRVPDLDPALEEVVVRMLAKSPQDRWPSLSEVARRLTQTPSHYRRTSEVRATIAQLARGLDAVEPARTFEMRRADASNAATEVATTPAPALVVTPAEPTIEIGESLQMRVSESSGASLGGVHIAWRSEDPTVATIDETGLVTGRSVGLAKITASAGAAFGRVAVTVRAPRVDTLVITPQSPELVTEHELQFVATVLDARGRTLVGQRIDWTTNDARICAVSQQGRAIGVAPGRATITATCGDIRGAAQVTVRLPAVERVVVEPGEVSIEAEESLALRATVLGPLDRALTGRAVTWRSNVPTVVAVDRDGTIRALSPGTAAVIATCDGRDGIASVTVRSQPVVAVRIQPASLELEIGRSLQLTGVGEDRRGRPVSDKGVEWHSDDDQIALVDASGKVHAVREGRTSVRAIAGDVTATINVAVVPRPARQIRIEAHQGSLAVGEFVMLDATVLDADGAPLTGRAVSWSSSDPAVVAINDRGACEAKKPGSVRITAACEQARATTKLSVAAAVVVTPGAAAPAVGAAARPSGPAPAATPRANAVARTSRVTPMLVGGAIVLVVLGGGWFALHGKAGSGGTGGNGVAAAPPGAAAKPDSAARSVTQPVTPPPSAQSTPTMTASGASGAGGGVAGRGDAAGRSATATNPGANAASQKSGPPGQGQKQDVAASGGNRGAPPQTAPVTRVDSSAILASRRDSIALARLRDSIAQAHRRDSIAAAARNAVTAPPPSTLPVAPPSRGGTSGSDARAATCASETVPANLLTAALAGDPVARITSLYEPRDAADGRAKQSLLTELKRLQGVKVAVRTIRSEAAAGGGCDWVMALDFTGTTFIGKASNRSDQVRVELDASGGAPRIKRVSGAGK